MRWNQKVVNVCTTIIQKPLFKLTVGTHLDEIPNRITRDKVVNIWVDKDVCHRSLHYLAHDTQWIQLGSLYLNNDGYIEEFDQNDHLCLSLPDIMYISDVFTIWTEGRKEM